MDSIHMGKLLERAVKRSSLTTLEVAEVLKINRRTLYNLFNQIVIREDTVSLINQALLSKVVVENKVFTEKIEASNTDNKEASDDMDTNSDWKNKYIHLIKNYSEMIDDDHREVNNN
jgi:hypothetical protein